jgi:nicotinate-nucleotide adenylyltransferase
MKIGLFGGSFDPIHNSHLKIINEVLNERLVDEVWIVPCGNHVFGKEMTDSKSRIEMIDLAINKNNRIKVKMLEINSNKPSYAIDTVNAMKSQFPEHKFYFIAGTDIVGDFEKWYRFEELAENVEFILHQRESYSIDGGSVMKIKAVLKSKVDNISSSEIRERIKKNLDVSELLPEKVLDYINKRGLYK